MIILADGIGNHHVAGALAREIDDAALPRKDVAALGNVTAVVKPPLRAVSMARSVGKIWSAAFR